MSLAEFSCPPIRVIRVGRFGAVPKRMKLFGLPGLNSILASRLSKLVVPAGPEVEVFGDEWEPPLAAN